MSTGLDFKFAQFDQAQGEADWGLDQNARAWNLVQSEDLKWHLIQIVQSLLKVRW
jgi:hypothetical protein